MATIDLRSAKANCVAIVHDLSATGARIETQSIHFELGDIVQLRLPFLPAEQRGEIAWTSGVRAGVRFCCPLEEKTFRFLARTMGLTNSPGALGVCPSTPPVPSLQSPEAQRCMERADVAIGATCRTQFGARGFVAMIDLTPQGCCLFGRELTFSPAQRLSLQPESLAPMKATVQWTRGSLTGVLFDTALYPAVFSHLATTYPWPLPETMKDALGPNGAISETVQRELQRMMDRTEKAFHDRNSSPDILTTRPPLVGTRPGIARQATDGNLAKLFLG